MQNKPPDGVIHRIAAAKLNLYLHITGRLERGERAGYHTLDSLVAFAAIGDVVRAEAGATLELAIEGPRAGELAGDAEDNLVYRAARALADYAGLGGGARLTLKKHLPTAAGLGGGSADAAAALHALNTLWRLSLDDDELRRIGLALGADVPVCLGGRAAHMTGVGETLSPVAALPECAVVLVNPGARLSTARVFAALEIEPSESEAPAARFADAAELAEALKGRRNDLEIAAIGMAPAIAGALESLAGGAGCLLARMSGSGATCFGLFADESAAVAAAERILHDHPGWWVVATHLVGDTQRLQEWAA